MIDIETETFMGIARDMLCDFYDMASNDRAMSMYMVPIKAYLKRYQKAIDERQAKESQP